MTDETPQSEGEPSPAPPEESATAETKPFTYDDAVQQAGDEDDVEPAPPATAPPAPEAAPEATEAAPVAAATTAPTAPVAAAPAPSAERPAGIFIPKWVGIVGAAIIAALIFGGIGYAIGDSDSGSSSNAASTFPNSNGNGSQQFPGGYLPNGGQLPGGGQFPGNGNSNGNGGSGTTTSNAGFLGVGVEATTSGKGVQVSDLAENSPAAKAGLQKGDVITAIDGKSVDSPIALRSAVQAKQSGDEISVTYTRDGSSNTVKVTLTSRAQAQSS